VTAIPERLRWAVEVLAIQPDDRVLEIGCGHGVAVSLIADRLSDGRVVAIDRSPRMIAAAEARNRAHIAVGRAAFHAVALADVAPDGQRFDKVFAVNVNGFWLRPEQELPIVRELLAPEGALYLFLQPPAAERAHAFAEAMPRHLDAHGFAMERVLIEPMQPAPSVCVITHLKEDG